MISVFLNKILGWSLTYEKELLN